MPASDLTEAKLASMAAKAFGKDKVKVLNHSVGPAADKGDEGNASEVCAVKMRVQLDGGDERELRWVVKTTPGKVFYPTEVVRALHMEQKEVEVYSKVRDRSMPDLAM